MPEIGQVWELYTNFGFFSAAKRLRPTNRLRGTARPAAYQPLNSMLGFRENDVDHLYSQALGMMGVAFGVLSRKVGDPQRQLMGDAYVYRYKEKSIYQAIIQKLARVVTGTWGRSYNLTIFDVI